jgi:ABC-type Fe3+-hydroxamate transport system substrate-binding protein
MPLFTDQLGRTVELTATPSRIVSLVPSQTELLYDLGLNEEVVGITKFCIHPQEWFTTKTRIGGTKNLNLPKIRSLQPDLIIANKEENVQDQVKALAAEYPVWISDVNDLPTAFDMISAVGKLVGRNEQATTIRSGINTKFQELNAWLQENKISQLKVAYFIWKDPYMVAAGSTFINDLLTRAGFTNVLTQLQRYPEITIDQLIASDCDLIFLSSEPYPFKQKHIEALQHFVPNKTILLVDGELFSWYGSRLLRSAEYFLQLHKQIQSLPLT